MQTFGKENIFADSQEKTQHSTVCTDAPRLTMVDVSINPSLVENIMSKMYLVYLTCQTSQLSLADPSLLRTLTLVYSWGIILSFTSRVIAFFLFSPKAGDTDGRFVDIIWDVVKWANMATVVQLEQLIS